jgi:hypothetical protein
MVIMECQSVFSAGFVAGRGLECGVDVAPRAGASGFTRRNRTAQKVEKRKPRGYHRPPLDGDLSAGCVRSDFGRKL